MARKTTKWTVEEEEQLWDYYQNNIGRCKTKKKIYDEVVSILGSRRNVKALERKLLDLEKMGKKKDDIKKGKTCDSSKLVGKISSNDIPKKKREMK
uniref:MADF domain-containing protein n=1 Tax=Strongyloides venezuelensis TaxID=75913 RepID=A0A0K0FAV0_STRVS